ncbi:MAG: hypothetical protein UZ17_ACD001002407 [Acidobacteria bacterium OLB17]|nr:MAG: hypothetical protein UZ17_ACD001002407 [Acidobacteria bacterium OLB17]MCZ2392120.1 hypothetical protein [Acidobacteriota bacterium]
MQRLLIPILLCAFVLLSFGSVVLAQTPLVLEKVELLKTTRDEFESTYGRPTGGAGVLGFRYLIKGGKVVAFFSSGPCTERWPYRVKENVVLSYAITFDHPPALIDVAPDLSMFRKDTSSDVIGVYQYLNDEEGIGIEVYQPFQGNAEVFRISRVPTEKQKKKMMCTQSVVGVSGTGEWDEG